MSIAFVLNFGLMFGLMAENEVDSVKQSKTTKFGVFRF